MATIIDFSDDPKFTIKTVASQTGIRPVTLRAWERRHEVLTPHRSDNRYRLYSERDVAILRWLKNRVDAGVSISNAVSELRGMASNGMWPEAVPTAPTLQPGKRSIQPALYIPQLFTALIHHDEVKASELLREMHAIFDLPTLFYDVLIPTLEEIGEAWYRGEIRVTTEHFASILLRGKLLTLLQAYPSRRNAPYVLVGCAPMEQHELGALMLAVLLRSNGYRVEYLGPDIPIEDLADYASYEKPNLIVLAATSESSALDLKSMTARLSKIRPTPPMFAYGGRAFENNPALVKQIPGIYLGRSLDDGLQTIREITGVKQPQRALALEMA